MMDDTPTHDVANLVSDIGELVEDAAEETFVLFSQDLPSNNLGILSPAAATIDVQVAGHDYTILQSPGLLRSSREAGTTGAVMWKVTPRVAEWLALTGSILWKRGLLNQSSHVVELGCGVAGVVALALAPLVGTYTLTDQAYVMKLLRENLATNQSTKPSKKRPKKGDADESNSLHLVTLDWEQDSVQNVRQNLPVDAQIDLVISCDCVYNSYLIDPLVQTCRDICLLNPTNTTMLLIAQQLRTDAIFEQWLTKLLKSFMVWRIKDEHLPSALNSASGYVVHVALLRQPL